MIAIFVRRLRRIVYYLLRGEFRVIADAVRHSFPWNSYPPLALQLWDGAAVAEILEFPEAGFRDPLVSIIVPVHNHWSTTRACLASILASTPGLRYEVILADDCSSDETVAAGKVVRNVRIVRPDRNQGFLRNCNGAARQARGKYLVLLNNDTNVQAGWLDALLRVAEADPAVALVGGMLIYPDGRLQEAGGIVWSSGAAHLYGRLEAPNRPEFNYLKPCDYVSGACLLVRRAFWEEVGGFDERYVPAYYEDTDLAFAARARGYKVVYQPACRTVHYEGVSHGTDVSAGTKAYQEANRRKFAEKWQPVLRREQAAGIGELFVARDRSQDRKTVLFVDHYVPMRDRDAGSRSTFQYLRLLAGLGYNVKFIGDNFMAHQPYTAELEQLGIEVLHGRAHALGWRSWLALHGRHIDYVWLSRPHIADKYLKAVRKATKARVLYCGHDLHALRARRQLALEPSAVQRREAARWDRLENEVLRKVDLAYFFSQVEVDELRRRMPQVRTRVVPLFLYDEVRAQAHPVPAFDARRDLLFVANFQHPPNAHGLRWFVEQVLPSVRERLGDVRLRVVGAAPPDIAALQGPALDIVGFVPDAQLQREYDTARVVVAPLRYGAGIKGKIVEAMCHGVPVVTTVVGAEGIGAADAGLTVADDPAQFAAAVATLYRDVAVWSARTADAAKVVAARFTVEAAKRILLEDLPLTPDPSRSCPF